MHFRHADAHPQRELGRQGRGLHASTKVLVEIARVIKEEGYIEGYEVEDTKPQKAVLRRDVKGLLG